MLTRLIDASIVALAVTLSGCGDKTGTCVDRSEADNTFCAVNQVEDICQGKRKAFTREGGEQGKARCQAQGFPALGPGKSSADADAAILRGRRSCSSRRAPLRRRGLGRPARYQASVRTANRWRVAMTATRRTQSDSTNGA